ncbi:malto-oligosyltrehalose trehalohydrolase [soil metagenome]
MVMRTTTPSTTQAFFGALPSQGGVLFRVWAPDVKTIALELLDGNAAGQHPLAPGDAAVFETWIRGAAAGDKYLFVVDGSERLPDPASRSQPDGVHGPSQVVDPDAYHWRDQRWQPRSPLDAIVYELHVGTFTPPGTFASARERLPYLRDLGVTVIELMPVAEFAGTRSWGYDGVALFAPSRNYGRPDDLRELVDNAHALGLAVMLDVVYNHLGPEGAYLPRFSRRYHTERHTTPWGNAVNVDGPDSAMVRRFIIDNATHWLREYHLDQALTDDTEPNIIVDLANAARAAVPRPVLIHAEDHRNFATMVEDPADGGWGLDGVWADDFHHILRRMVAGDSHGYFADYAGNAMELATALREGWLYSGQVSAQKKHPRGTSPSGVPLYRFVLCLQNHDQVGNRAMGERLHHSIAEDSWRAASVVLLTAPATPLLFMGQEWAASTPFQYFTDLEPGLGRLVTDGRRKEFAESPEFSEESTRLRIPDAQSESTFAASHLKWGEHTQGRHARALALHKQLLALRAENAAVRGSPDHSGEAVAPDDETVVTRRSDGSQTFWIVARFKTAGEVDLAAAASSLGHELEGTALATVLDTEHAEFASDPQAIAVSSGSGGTTVRFARPGAIILKER